jgi:hypothetical protein
MTLVEQERIIGRFEETNFSSGQSFSALLEAIAECMPFSRAS